MTPRRTALPRQHGFSMIELMISMVIGLVVIGAVLATYLATSVAGRNSQALSQINEDANVALNVLRMHVGMVGYSQPLSLASGGSFNPAYAGVGLFGCDGAFSDLSVAIGSLACGTQSTTASDSIAIAYEVDASNAEVSSTGAPLDCLGNALTASGSPSYYLSYSRFYLSVPSGGTLKSLYCRGAGNASAQALVENVVDMQITYGLVAPVVPNQSLRVARYATANGLVAADFKSAVAARICIVVASAGNVMDAVTPYQGCDPFSTGVITPASGDRRLYRAFTTTIVLQNRLGA